jgi:uncharacterized protein YuzE
MPRSITYDHEADAAYAGVGSGPVDRTIEIGEGLLVDLGADGRPVGVEVLRVAPRVGSRDRTAYLRSVIESVLGGLARPAS